MSFAILLMSVEFGWSPATVGLIQSSFLGATFSLRFLEVFGLPVLVASWCLDFGLYGGLLQHFVEICCQACPFVPTRRVCAFRIGGERYFHEDILIAGCMGSTSTHCVH